MDQKTETPQANDTIEHLQAGAHDTVDKVADVSRDAARSLGQKGEQLRNAEQQLMEDLRNYMREKPMTTLALAVGGGFLLSRLMSD